MMPETHGIEGGGRERAGVIFLNKFLKRNQLGKQFSSFTHFLETLGSVGLAPSFVLGLETH